MDITQTTTYRSGIALAAAHRSITRVVSDYLLQYELTAMQWFIIGYVYDHGKEGLRLTDLTNVLHTTLPYTTTTINLLESKGIVLKKGHSTDNRTKLVSINPSFHKTIDVIEKGLRKELREKLYNADNVSRDELETYITVLHKIAGSSEVKK